MCDFDPSQALDDSCEVDATGFESSCFNMTDLRDEIFKLDEGLDVVVSHNPRTLRSVAYLLLGVNRMQKSLTQCGRELSDDELCCAIMDSLVTETVVERTASSATTSASAEAKRVYERVNSGNQCTLLDLYRKHIVLTSEECQLLAVTLKGGNCERKVNFKLARYISSIIKPDESLTVLLSLKSNLHISCSMKDDKAVLTLEECSKEDLKSISEDGDMDRFLFFKRTKGMCENMFESVKYRGWFISTSDAENQPVELCKVDAKRHLTFRMD
ncbi:interleukin-1 beta isoform X1 [Epinephelus moara]|uniref:interleukin-1 beta isoform X1 n=1 Tax=Epinephelus moara TaxID=300413 RepID=UPI00214F153F|nr:interleukin-1 beta isoform X1 [Epinephelus moara]